MRIFNKKVPRSELSRVHMMTLPVEVVGTAATTLALAMEAILAAVVAMVTIIQALAMEAILAVGVVETTTELPAQHRIR